LLRNKDGWNVPGECDGLNDQSCGGLVGGRGWVKLLPRKAKAKGVPHTVGILLFTRRRMSFKSCTCMKGQTATYIWSHFLALVL
jgi:hypothetical protein